MTFGSSKGQDNYEKIFDCEDCGACCRCYPIFASEADAVREPRIEDNGIRIDQFQGTDQVAYRIFPLANKSGCAFLQENQLCRIYESRPDICRRFESGSEQCIRARERVGIGRSKS